MSTILGNDKLSEDFYLMRVRHKNNAKMGQFYMLRAWDKFPILSRPISIFDRTENELVFLYKVVGSGSEIFSKLKKGDEIVLDGPHGNTFPEFSNKKIALVGGGVGIAPLHLASKNYSLNNHVNIYLGFSKEALLENEYGRLCNNLTINIAGYITDDIDTREYDVIISCGPDIMMRKLNQKIIEQNSRAQLYVSLENRMACGFGACLVCSCSTKYGNKRVCVEGPIFLAKEVYHD